MAKKMFSQGYSAVREEKKRQDDFQESMGKQLWRFFLKEDGDEAEVLFLTEEPITFREHTIKTSKGYDNKICTGDTCEYCEDGDRPSFKSAFLIWDKRPYTKIDDKGKKKKVEGQLRLYVAGTKISSQLDRLSSKYGLTANSWTIAKTGEGKQTSYSIERGEPIELDEDEILKMFPEKLAELYDGSEESLYDIVKTQLKMLIEEDTKSTSSKKRGKRTDDDEDEEDSSSNLVGDDDDEDELPKKSKPLTSKKPASKGTLKSADSSTSKVKSLLKNKIKRS